MADGTVKIKVHWDDSGLSKEITATKKEIESKLADSTTVKADVVVDDAAVKDLQSQLDSLDAVVTPEIKIEDSQLDVASDKLADLAATVSPKVTVDDAELDQAQKKIDDLDGETVSVKIEADTSGFDVAGALGLAGVTAGVTALTASTQEYNEDLAKLRTNAEIAGQEFDNVNASLKAMNAITGETDSNVEALSNLMQAGFTDNALTDAVDALSGAVIKFPDTLKIESLADGLQETLATGAAIGPFAELLERMGVDLDTFNEGLANAAVNGQELDYVMATLESLDLSSVNQQFREQNESIIANRNAQFELNAALAAIGETITPVIVPLVEGFAGLLNVLVENKDTVGLIITVVGTALGLFKAWQIATAAVTAAQAALNAVLALNPIALIIIAIAALVAGFIYLWNTSEEFRQFWIDLWDGIYDFFAGIVDGIVVFFTETIPGAVTSMLDLVQGAFTSLADFAKGVFDGLVSIIKSPFNLLIGVINTIITGINSIINGLNTLSVDLPDWLGGGTIGFDIPTMPEIPYLAKGGIVPHATLAMVGEAGKEAVLPLEKNTGWMDTLADKVAARSGQGGNNLRVESAPGLTAFLRYKINAENRRRGVRLTRGGNGR